MLTQKKFLYLVALALCLLREKTCLSMEMGEIKLEETKPEEATEISVISTLTPKSTSSTSTSSSSNQNQNTQQDTKKQLTPEELEKKKRRDAAMRAIRLVQGLTLTVQERNPNNPYPLHNAQTPEEVTKLIADGYSPIRFDDNGFTALHSASSLAVLEAVIASGCYAINVKTRDSYQTCLHTAKTPEIAQFFLERGVSLFSKDKEGNTPFHTACNLAITQALYDYLTADGNAIDLSFLNNIKNKNGKNPLHLAKSPEQARFLIEHGMDPDITDRKSEAELAAFHDTDTALVILDAQELKSAITTRNWQRMEALLSRKTAVNKLLLDQTDTGGNTLLHLAAVNDKHELVQLLLEAGADAKITNTLKRTALHYARSANAIKALIEGEADPDAQDVEGNTALHYIVSNETPIEPTRTLLKEDANAGKQNNKGDTPLHYTNNLAVAQLLVQHGASPNIQNKKGQTPLHVYVQESDRLCSQLIALGRSSEGKSKLKFRQDMYHELIKHFVNILKVDINLYDGEENRPLHCTSELDIIELLIKAGAHVNKRNLAGHTALTLAAIAYGNKDASPVIQEKYKEIIALLLERGAQVQPISPRSRRNSPHKSITNSTDSNRDYPDHQESDDEEEEKKVEIAQKDAVVQAESSNQTTSTSTSEEKKVSIPLLVLPITPANNEAPDTGRLVSARIAEILNAIQQNTPKSPQECYHCLKGFSLPSIIRGKK